MKLHELDLCKLKISIINAVTKQSEYKNFKLFLSEVGLKYQGKNEKRRIEELLSNYISIEKTSGTQKITVNLKDNIENINLNYLNKSRFTYYSLNLFLNKIAENSDTIAIP